MDQERQDRIFLHNAKEVAAFATTIQAGTLVRPGARVRAYVVERVIPANSKENEILSHWQMVDIFKVSYFPPDISSIKAMVAWTVVERRKK